MKFESLARFSGPREGFITSTVIWRCFVPDLFAGAVIILRFIFRCYKIGLRRCPKKFIVFTMLFTLLMCFAAKCGLILLILLNAMKKNAQHSTFSLHWVLLRSELLCVRKEITVSHKHLFFLLCSMGSMHFVHNECCGHICYFHTVSPRAFGWVLQMAGVGWKQEKHPVSSLILSNVILTYEVLLWQRWQD